PVPILLSGAGAAGGCSASLPPPKLPNWPKLPILPPAHAVSISPAATQNATVRLRRECSFGSFCSGDVLDMVPLGRGVRLSPFHDSERIYLIKVKAMKEKGILSWHDGYAVRV
ncbi:MAG: hypothetical protein P8Y53_22225, partial [Pseudolabrys sp.]